MAICPYCNKKITLDASREPAGDRGDPPREVRREVKGLFKKEIMYICPHCDIVLGFGSFMGGLLTGRP